MLAFFLCGCGGSAQTPSPAFAGSGADEAGSSGSMSAGAGSSDAASSGMGGSNLPNGTCATDDDCGGDGLCGFPTADGCSAKGTCFVRPKVECLLFEPGCACDGTEISIACNGLPTGYEPKPYLHSGPCGK